MSLSLSWAFMGAWGRAYTTTQYYPLSSSRWAERTTRWVWCDSQAWDPELAAWDGNDIVNKNGKIGHHCLVPDMRRNSFSFSFWLQCGCCLVIYGLYHFEVFSFYTIICWGFLSWNTKYLLCIYWKDHMAFVLRSVDMIFDICWFLNVGPPLHFWDKSPLDHDMWSFWCSVGFGLQIFFFFLRIFASRFIENICGLCCLCLCVLCLVLMSARCWLH